MGLPGNRESFPIRFSLKLKTMEKLPESISPPHFPPSLNHTRWANKAVNELLRGEYFGMRTGIHPDLANNCLEKINRSTADEQIKSRAKARIDKPSGKRIISYLKSYIELLKELELEGESPKPAPQPISISDGITYLPERGPESRRKSIEHNICDTLYHAPHLDNEAQELLHEAIRLIEPYISEDSYINTWQKKKTPPTPTTLRVNEISKGLRDKQHCSNAIYSDTSKPGPKTDLIIAATEQTPIPLEKSYGLHCYTLLQIAARNWAPCTLDELMKHAEERNIDKFPQDIFGNTPAHYCKHEEKARILINHDAPAGCENIFEDTPITSGEPMRRMIDTIRNEQKAAKVLSTPKDKDPLEI
jgi:hypothetical protein